MSHNPFDFQNSGDDDSPVPEPPKSEGFDFLTKPPAAEQPTSSNAAHTENAVGTVGPSISGRATAFRSVSITLAVGATAAAFVVLAVALVAIPRIGVSGEAQNPVVPAAEEDRATELVAESRGLGRILAGTAEPSDIGLAIEAGDSPKESMTGAVAHGPSVSVTTERAFDGYFLVELPLPPKPNQESLPGVWHVADDGAASFELGSWDPVGNTLLVKARSFSTRTAGWWQPSEWLERAASAVTESVDWVVDEATGRTDPPPCDDNAPAWATVHHRVKRTVHVCGQSRTGEGEWDDLEVVIKSNRGYTQLVLLPWDVEDVVIDGQPDWLQPIASWLYTTPLGTLSRIDVAINDNVWASKQTYVLPDGGTMSFRMPRPIIDLEHQVVIGQNIRSKELDAVEALVGPLLEGAESASAFLVGMTGCLLDLIGVDPSSIEPRGADGPFMLKAIECLTSAAADPDLASELVDGMGRHLDLSSAARGKAASVFKGGGKFFAVAAAAKFAFGSLDGAHDALYREDIELELEGYRRADSTGETVPGFTGSGRLDCGDGGIALEARVPEAELSVAICGPDNSQPPTMVYYVESTGERGSGPLCVSDGGDSHSEIYTGRFGQNGRPEVAFRGETLQSINLYYSADTEGMTAEEFEAATGSAFEDVEWRSYAESWTGNSPPWSDDGDSHYAAYEAEIDLNGDLLASMEIDYCPESSSDI